MNLSGRRIHIAGSASPEVDETKLSYVHNLVAALVKKLADEGAAFLVPFGAEPLLKEKDSGPSIIFDWTVIETLGEALKSGLVAASSTNGKLITTISRNKATSNIPAHRQELHAQLRKAEAITTEFIEPGWSSGAYRRQRESELGDILIAISGGEGVERLALEYSKKGKPVIPLDINLGSSQNDGSGGASRLFTKALAESTKSTDFFRLDKQSDAADLLDQTRTNDASVAMTTVVDSVVKLLHALTPPQVFYVRLLNNKHEEYDLTEKYFRNVVDPLVKELGYSPVQMGIGTNEFAWMNKAIFDLLHHSSVVFVDLTGLRTNCFMELGYALGNKQRVIITARSGTQFPFDSSSLEACIWEETDGEKTSIDKLRTHWERNINIPHLVKQKEAK